MTNDELIRVLASARTDLNGKSLLMKGAARMLYEGDDVHDNSTLRNLEDAQAHIEDAVDHVNQAILQLGGHA